jgi:hypothetical protein
MYQTLVNTEGLIRDLSEDGSPKKKSWIEKQINDIGREFRLGFGTEEQRKEAHREQVEERRKKINQTGTWKKGGIIKAQGGVKINPAKRVSWEEYTAKINKSSAPVSTTEAPEKTIKD